MSAGWLWLVAAVAMVGVVMLHLLSVQRPPSLWLPTARFLPEGTLRAVSRAKRPSDLLLLALRLLALAAATLAFVGTTCASARVPIGAIVVIDRTGVYDSAAWSRAVAHSVNDTTPVMAVVLVDDVAHTIAGDALTTFRFDTLTPVSRYGDLAAGIVAARRAAPSFASQADSLTLRVVSTQNMQDTRNALPAVRAAWPGALSLIPVVQTRDTATTTALASAPEFRLSDRADVVPRSALTAAALDDPVVAAVTLHVPRTAHRVRVIRGALQPDDARAAEAGATLVVWPVRGAPSSAPGAETVFAGEHAWQVDSSPAPAALASAGRAFVGALARNARPVANNKSAQRRAAFVQTETSATQHAVWWWADGTVAATEQPLGRGCVRAVGVRVPPDAALLAPTAQPLLAQLLAPCAQHAGAAIRSGESEAVSDASPNTEREAAATSDTAWDAVQNSVASRPLATASLPDIPPPSTAPNTRLLLGITVALLLLEWWLRSRRAAAAPPSVPHASARPARPLAPRAEGGA